MQTKNECRCFFYLKSLNRLPIVIEQFASSSRTDAMKIIILPSDRVDEETDEEELDDNNLATEEISAEFAGKLVYSAYTGTNVTNKAILV